MKAARPFLLGFVATGSLMAAEPADPPAAPTRLSEVIRASLPPYTPPPPRPLDTPHEATSSDPDVLVLPKMTVREKYQPRIDPIDLLTRKGRDKAYAAEYRNSLKGLDAVLNGFSIPFFGKSQAALGRELHIRRQFEDLHFISTVGAKFAPEGSAAAQKAEADMKRAIEWQNRPAGGK